MFEMKPDFNEVMNRYEAWWDCAIIDRPILSIVFPKPTDQWIPGPEKQPNSLRERWTDAGYVAESTNARLANTVYFADSLPAAWPNLGPEVFSAMYGCELEFGESTTWSKPILSDFSPESIEKIQIDTNNQYFLKLMEITDALLDIGREKFIVGYTDMHGGADAIAAFRDPQEFLLDVIMQPEAVKALCDRITNEFLMVYDLFYDKLTAAGMPSTSWTNATCKGKFHIPSNDFSCMISDESFETLFIPGIIQECRHMDRCIYHLDGPQALRFLDILLEIPEIDAIQWVPGAGRDTFAEWIGVYQRIQSKNKALQIQTLNVKDIDLVFQSLKPEGVWISAFTGISNQEEAESVLNAFSKWT